MASRLRIPAFLAILVLSSAAPGQDQGTRRALLIGINAYKSVPPLNGCVNDIGRMERILRSKFGFTKFTRLTDAQATRDNIVAAFRKIVADAGPNDAVYVHFSGHGSQVRDFSGDERKADKLDETLIPVNGRTPGVRDITDDEIAAIFNGFKTNNVVICFDSCHSGTATRSVSVKTRGVPRDGRDDLYEKAPRTRAVTTLRKGIIAFGGAAPHQQALDGPCDGRAHGLFTYALARSLERAGPDTSLLRIMGLVRVVQQDLMAKLNLTHMPEPQLEGTQEQLSRPMFATRGTAKPAPAATAAKTWVNVLRITGSMTQLLLENAAPVGARVGTVWAVYPPNETQFRRKAVATVTVTQVNGENAVATMQRPAMILNKSRAILIATSRQAEPVSVRLLDVPDDQRTKLRAAFGKVAGHIEIVGNDKPARFHLDFRGGEWVLSGATGTQRLSSTNELDHVQVASRMAGVMSRSLAANELMSLSNPNAAMSLDVRLAGQPASLKEQITGRGLKITTMTEAAPYRIHKEGQPHTEQTSVAIEVTPSRDSYVTIVGVDQVGDVVLLFPNSASEPRGFYPKGFVRAGQRAQIPDSIRLPNRAGFVIECAPPAGATTMRVFASTDLETAEMIRKYVNEASAAVTKTRSAGKTDTTEALGALGKLHAYLTTRAVHVVTQPAGQQPPPPPQPGQQPAPPPPQQQPAPPPQQQQPQYQPVANDWTAATVTFQVSE